MPQSKHGLNILAMSLASPGTNKNNNRVLCHRCAPTGLLARESPCRESQKHQKEQDDAKKDETRPGMMARRMMKFGWAGGCGIWVNLRTFVMQTLTWKVPLSFDRSLVQESEEARRGCPKDMGKEQVAQYRPTVMDSANMI